MKKVLFLFVFAVFIVSCEKDPPIPDPIDNLAYLDLHHFILEYGEVVWFIDSVELENKQSYGMPFFGSVVLDSTQEEITVKAMNLNKTEVIDSISLPMENNGYYMVALLGNTEEQSMVYGETDSHAPNRGEVKIQFLHAAPATDSVDVYVGGTESTDKAVSDLSFGERSGYTAYKDYVFRNSVVVSKHADQYSEENVLINYQQSELILSERNYLLVLARRMDDPSSDLALWLFSQRMLLK